MGPHDERRKQSSADEQHERSNHLVTVTVAVPLLLSLVAVIVAVPCFFPVTSPPCVTVAVIPELVVHVIVRPVSTFPFASFNVAVSVTVASSAKLADDGETVTVATGA